MWVSLPVGASKWPVMVTLLAWGAAELALRLRLAVRLAAPAEPDLAVPAGSGTRSASSLPRAMLGRLLAARERLREWTLYLVVIMTAGAAVTAVWATRVRWLRTGAGPAVLVAGELLALAGIALRIWAIFTLDRLFTFAVGIAADHRVVQNGPYRFMRHPGYAGALLALVGVGVALGNWLSLLILAVIPALVLAVRITVEEATLRAALGPEYVAYAARTARLIPGVW